MSIKNKFVSVLLALSTAASVFAVSAGAAGGEAEAERPKLTVGRLTTPPTIDGVFHENEWGSKSFTLAANQPNVTVHKEIDKATNKEKPVKKATGDVYLGYDETHFYVCVVTTYPDHKSDVVIGAQLWSQDCLQTKISATKDGPIHNDFDFGLSSATNKALVKNWNGHGVTATLKPGNNKDFMITRTGDVTTYEIAYPLKSFATTVMKLQKGKEMAFSMAQHMNGGGFYEFAGGIVKSKDLALTAVILLGDDKKLDGGKTNPQVTSPDKNPTTSKQQGNNTTKPNITTTKPTDVSGTTGTGETDPSGVTTGTGNTEIPDGSTTTEAAISGTTSSSSNESDQTVNKDDTDKKSPLGWIIGIIAAVVVLGGGAAVYFLVIRKRLNHRNT